MNEFLKLFSASLRHMRPDEKEDILQDFKEHFEIGLASGKTENEITQELGDPCQLAKMYSAEYATNKAVESNGVKDTLRMIGAIISYKIGGGLLIFTLYFVSLSVTLLLFASAATLITGGIGCAVMIALELVKGYWTYAVLAFFGALALVCGGMIWWLGTKRLWQVTVMRLPLLGRRITRINIESSK